jgi:hypothetical protein
VVSETDEVSAWHQPPLDRRQARSLSRTRTLRGGAGHRPGPHGGRIGPQDRRGLEVIGPEPRRRDHHPGVRLPMPCQRALRRYAAAAATDITASAVMKRTKLGTRGA